MLKIFASAAALWTVTAVPALAQDQAIVAAPGQSWQHSKSGVTLPVTIAGLERVKLTEIGAGELDVAVQFFNAAHTQSLTIYLFRPALHDLAMWFDRSEAQILLREDLNHAAGLAPPLAFAPSGQTTAAALRRTYVPGGGDVKSTALAMMPSGEWLVAIRLSANDLEPAALDAKLSEVIGAIRWPAASASPNAAATPILPCTSPLSYPKRAKPKRPTMESGIMGALLAGIVADKKASNDAPVENVIFCRETEPRTDYGVYRAAAATDSYVIALGDAGRTIGVGPEFSFESKSPGYSVNYNELDSTAVYAGFDKLPRPEQALAMAMRDTPMSRSSRDGKSITIDSGNK